MVKANLLTNCDLSIKGGFFSKQFRYVCTTFMSLCNPIEAFLTNRWILKNLECNDASLVGFASKGKNMEQCSFHLVPCFEECSPCICSCELWIQFFGNFIKHKSYFNYCWCELAIRGRATAWSTTCYKWTLCCFLPSWLQIVKFKSSFCTNKKTIFHV